MSEEPDGELGESLQAAPKITVCPECGGPKLMRDYEAAEIVCMACGCVIDEKLADTRPEWRAFDDDQKKSRTRVWRSNHLRDPRQGSLNYYRLA